MAGKSKINFDGAAGPRVIIVVLWQETVRLVIKVVRPIFSIT